MSRPVILDATSLLAGRADAVERMLAADLTPPSGAIVLGRRGVASVPLMRVARASSRPDIGVSKIGGDDRVLHDIVSWLLDAGDAAPPRAPRSRPRQGFRDAMQFARPSAIPGVMPGGTVFVKVGLQGWNDPGLDHWMESRPDLVGVAIVDDLWSLDHPEYVPGETLATMRQCFDRLARSARALIVPTEVARHRAETILGEPGRHGITLHVVPPPSELAGTEEPPFSPSLAANPFVVVAGPLESRGNLAHLLTLWRERVIAGQPVPKLVLAGPRGSQIEDLRPLLDWNENLKPYLREADGLSPMGLRMLLAHADAVLAPDFAVGSGALVRDAQAIGTPVIASAIPTFREVLSADARFLHPLDGSGWSKAVGALRAGGSRSPTHKARLPDWSTFRATLQAIVTGL